MSKATGAVDLKEVLRAPKATGEKASTSTARAKAGKGI